MGGLLLLQHLGGSLLALQLLLPLLLFRRLAGLVALPLQLAGGSPGLGVLLVDDLAVFVPLGGLKHLHGEGVVLQHRYFPADQLLNVLQQRFLAEIAEGDGLSSPSGPAGASDAWT